MAREKSLLVTKADVADMLSVSERTVSNLVKEGVIPKGRKVGGKNIRWSRKEIKAIAERLMSLGVEADPDEDESDNYFSGKKVQEGARSGKALEEPK
jgi:predicted DNA-binding transcriptional regulator AlpA